jgi:branched-chain amino acid transport system substrate-binding protein
MANLWVQMLDAAGKDLNTKTFDEAANGGSFVYKPGHPNDAGNVPYPGGHFLPSPCAAMLKVESAKYVIGKPFECYGLIPAG